MIASNVYYCIWKCCQVNYLAKRGFKKKKKNYTVLCRVFRIFSVLKTLQQVWKYCYSLLLGIDTLWKMLSVPNFYKILPRWSINILHNKIPVCNSMKLESSHTGSCNIDCFQTNFHHQIFLKVKKIVKKRLNQNKSNAYQMPKNQTAL